MADQPSLQLTTVKKFLDYSDKLDFDNAFRLLADDFEFEILGTKPRVFNRQEYEAHHRKHVIPNLKPPEMQILDIIEERNSAKEKVGIVVNMESKAQLKESKHRNEMYRIFYVKGDRIAQLKAHLDSDLHDAFQLDKDSN